MSQLQSHTQHRGIGGTGHGGQHWMMLACCIPMLLVAITLICFGICYATFMRQEVRST